MVKSRGDMVIISVSVALILIGILFIYSSSGPFCKFMNPPRPTWYFLIKQLFWSLIAISLMFFMYRLDYEFMVKISPGLIIVSIITLAIIFPLSGAHIKRWISLGGISFQPSEFFKIALVVFLARIAGKSEWRDGYKRFMPALILALLGTLLVLLEPDLGTTALLLTVTGVILYLSGFKKRHLLVIPVIGAAAVTIMVFGIGYERDRIDSYVTTLKDPFHEEANYQTRQSLVSLGSGGVVGKGLANGGQKHLFLPERHTDFILSAAAEEGGFLLVASIFILFGIFGFAAYKIAFNAVNIEGVILVWGISTFILLQASINIGVALGLLPVTGMTLPFVSYGGSSLISCSIGAGMIASVARRSRSPRKYFKRSRV
ncbi:MAG: cell division protein FtsW [Candidatus Zixiibacteriota bacterium]|nr:MAG: cell division protein FtsW [candidate division Zixibacteria bacterium]